jgi:hypothetical protein
VTTELQFIIIIKYCIHFSGCVLNFMLPVCGPSHKKLSRPVLSNLSITAEKSRTVQSSNLCPRSDRDTTGEGERQRQR